MCAKRCDGTKPGGLGTACAPGLKQRDRPLCSRQNKKGTAKRPSSSVVALCGVLQRCNLICHSPPRHPVHCAQMRVHSLGASAGMPPPRAVATSPTPARPGTWRRTPAALGAPVAAACSSAVRVLHGCARCAAAPRWALQAPLRHCCWRLWGRCCPARTAAHPPCGCRGCWRSTRWQSATTAVPRVSTSCLARRRATSGSCTWKAACGASQRRCAANKPSLSSGPESFAPCARRCYDQTSCDYRFKNAGYSMSSSTWKDYFSQGGIFETNPVKSPIAGVRQPRAALAHLWLNSRRACSPGKQDFRHLLLL